MYKTIKLTTYDGGVKLYEKYKPIIRFIIVGCINTGVDFVAFMICNKFFLFDNLVCQVTGYSMGMINSFLLNKAWTFENNELKYNTKNQIIRFIGVNAISLGASLVGLKLINEDYGINIYVSKLIVTGIAQVVNYFGYKLWVFDCKKG